MVTTVTRKRIFETSLRNINFKMVKLLWHEYHLFITQHIPVNLEIIKIDLVLIIIIVYGHGRRHIFIVFHCTEGTL